MISRSCVVIFDYELLYPFYLYFTLNIAMCCICLLSDTAKCVQSSLPNIYLFSRYGNVNTHFCPSAVILMASTNYVCVHVWLHYFVSSTSGYMDHMLLIVACAVSDKFSGITRPLRTKRKPIGKCLLVVNCDLSSIFLRFPRYSALNSTNHTL